MSVYMKQYIEKVQKFPNLPTTQNIQDDDNINMYHFQILKIFLHSFPTCILNAM
jgi:hypothetical protein